MFWEFFKLCFKAGVPSIPIIIVKFFMISLMTFITIVFCQSESYNISKLIKIFKTIILFPFHPDGFMLSSHIDFSWLLI